MKIGIIGCGNMGQALLEGLIAGCYTSRKNIFCCDKDEDKINSIRSRFGVSVTTSNNELVKKSDVIILAVKPQDVDAALQDVLSPMRGKLLISICAGISTQWLQECLGNVSVVRVIPNMPALISQGISAISLGKYATKRDRKLVVSIFSCIGEVVEIKEQLMGAVTAISGSGPAYFFYLAENLIKTAKKLGIPHRTAQRLAIKTALGSAMLMNQAKESPQILRSQVASKGGTTEAAFNVFRKKGLDKTLTLAFKTAARRSKQLKNKG